MNIGRIHSGTLLAALASTMMLVACGEEAALLDDVRPTGALHLYVNGEERARDGFTAKDGWSLTFEHVYINLHGPTAVQVAVDEGAASAPLVPQHAGHPHPDIDDALAHVALVGDHFVDLAAGDAPLRLGTLEAPIGNYNYINVDVVPADHDSQGLVDAFWGQSLVFMGTAVSDATELAFTLRFDEALVFTECGPVEDDTGVVAEGDEGWVEFTFHLDHLFGDVKHAGTDEAGMNDDAVGFSPFADLADEGVVDLYQGDLEASWDAETYDQLLAMLSELGHAGEAHCR